MKYEYLDGRVVDGADLPWWKKAFAWVAFIALNTSFVTMGRGPKRRGMW